jgi:GNAT superfamily N-acetyltransferase
MLAGTRGTRDDRSAAIRLFAVDPEHRRRGVASVLLRETEARLREDGHARLRIGNSAPVYFWPGVDVRYTPALVFLQENGFARSGDAVNMEVILGARSWDTAADEARLAEDGVEVRRATEEDRMAFREWLRAVWGPTWEHEALCSYQNDPVSAFLALRGGEIRAFAAYGGTAFENAFGPTGTDEALRGRGIGGVLFRRCMRDLAELSHATCDVNWVGPVAFYAKVAGAHIHRVFWHFEKAL